MDKRTIIILGSSRSDGETRLIVDYINRDRHWDLLDLNDKEISYFDYTYQNEGDDFLPTIRHILENYDTLVFASPVYWYTMSAVMKTFFDRISDLLAHHKPLGRTFRGKRMAVISSSSEEALVHGYYMPFRESARYLGMDYIGDLHSWLEDGELPRAVREKADGFLK